MSGHRQHGLRPALARAAHAYGGAHSAALRWVNFRNANDSTPVVMASTTDSAAAYE